MLRFSSGILHHQKLLKRFARVRSKDSTRFRVWIDSEVVHKVLERSNHQRVEKRVHWKATFFGEKLFQRVDGAPVELVGGRHCSDSSKIAVK